MSAVIFDNKEALFKGQKILASLGYSVEVGAKHLNVTIDSNYSTEQASELEQKLQDLTACQVWVMQKQGQKMELQKEVDEMIAYLTIWKINITKEKERLKK